MKTFLRILLLTVVALGTAIAIFYAWTDWAGARHWKSVEADLRAKGEPVTIADVVPKPIPDEMNFAAAPIFAEIEAQPVQSKCRISQIRGFKGASPRKGSSDLANAARSVDPKFDGSDADAARVILAQMDRWKPILNEVREAAQRPGTDWKLDYHELWKARISYVSVLVTLAQTFSTEAKAHLALGDSEAAHADFELILDLSERASPPPLLISFLVREAIINIDISVAKFGIEHHAWTEAELERIQHAFGGIRLRSEFIDALQTERICFNDALLEFSQQHKLAVAMLSSSSASKLQEESLGDHIGDILWTLRPTGWVNEDRCAYSEAIQGLIQEISSSKPCSSPTFLRLKALSWLQRWRTPFTPLSVQAVEPLVERTFYGQVLIDEARTACAIERYRLAHGTLPQTLAALCPEFMSSVPMDPMSGQPLHYRPGSGDSYILYSVGWNQKDDGGSELNLEHQKVTVPHPPDTLDWIWKVGNPS